MTAQKLIEYAKQNGGCTTSNGEILNLTEGYAVATTNNIIKDIHTQAGMCQAINLVNTMTDIIGFWIDTDTNEMYIDAVLLHTKKDVALFVARKYNQKAIFDFANMCEILC